MKSVFVCVFAFVLPIVLESCDQSQPKPAIVIDDWFNVDGAKALCTAGPTQQMCQGSSQLYMRGFEGNIYAAAASDAACHGITFYVQSFDSHHSEPKHSWRLFISSNQEEAPQHGWSLEEDKPSPIITPEGSGTPQQIAHIVCMMANGTGADVEQL